MTSSDRSLKQFRGAFLRPFFQFAQEAVATQNLRIRRTKDGYVISLAGPRATSGDFYLLAETSSLPRVFKSLDTAVDLIAKSGIERVDLYLTGSRFLL